MKKNTRSENNEKLNNVNPNFNENKETLKNNSTNNTNNSNTGNREPAPVSPVSNSPGPNASNSSSDSSRPGCSDTSNPCSNSSSSRSSKASSSSSENSSSDSTGPLCPPGSSAVSLEKMTVNIPGQAYPIYFTSGYLSRCGDLLRQHLPETRKVFIISDDNVFPLYGSQLIASLEEHGFTVSSGTIRPGEASKTLETAAGFFDELIEQHFERNSVIISLGGGVVGDLAGFVAATYMRGIKFVQVPTSLLAQVDSSIGGKVAVNHPRGKNIIGAFHQPELVFIDVATLSTLAEREFITGMGEIIKHGVGFNYDYLKFLQQNAAEIQQQNPDLLLQMIYGSCNIKRKIVEEDEKEKGPRARLNLGHSVAHALETLTDYTHLTHGEAVAIGLVQEARLAEKLELISSDLVQEIITTLQQYSLPVELPSGASGDKIPARDILTAMASDKKSFQGKVSLALPSDPGECQIIRDWQEEDLLQILSS